MSKKYKCDSCNYSTNRHFDYKRHMNSKKHMSNLTKYTLLKNNGKSYQKYDDSYQKYENISSGVDGQKNKTKTKKKCDYCKKYISYSNFSKHMKVCNKFVNTI